ncbi:hypoxia up-regulated protein 1 isoform X2 [Copidosoma floridanum]|uniref:hypoxia up-regulated protein 1 isoform X2 n=1 Tax=Copidosoma floridanum TaxID=29053 RepID=UPI0006C9C4C1|nr:hypoxia up-regulated protein 1 isoform X2 [Copidosoma floridanum]
MQGNKMAQIKKFVVALLTLLSISLMCSQTYGLAVMSVDLGSEWMKVAIVMPGVPMEIALNKESKRKTPAIISYHNERTFGEDAQAVGTRFPKDCFSYILDLVGKSIDNPVVQLFQKRFPYYNVEADPERNTIIFRIDEKTTYSPEELIAQLLGKAKEFAERAANQVIKEAVIVVPGFFNQAERHAILQAAHLANIKALQLFNDYSAVALNYGIFNRKLINDTASYVMFYDMGASSTTATLVSYQNVKTKERGFVEIHPQVSILGVGYDRTLGGLEMTLRLRDYLAKEFDAMKKTSKSVFDDPRAYAKLFKEAERLKTVLSANSDHYAQIEGLLDKKDFKLLVTREKFEELCADLFERVAKPVEIALKTSGLTLDSISQVVLVGAGTRVPKVQEKLTEYVKTELAKNINTDEAAAIGAAYKAADLSKGFKVQKFITKDAVLFPIQIVFDRVAEDGVKQVKKTLFDKMNPYPQKKIITFNKHNQDFTFNVNYAKLDHLPEKEIAVIGNLNISTVSLIGVADALAKHSNEGAESKGIKAHFAMDESGILNLINTELVSEKTIIPSAEEEGAFSKLGSDETEKKETAEKTEDTPKDDVKPIHEEPDYPGLKKEAEEQAKANETKPIDEKADNKTEKASKKPTTVLLKEPIESKVEKLGPLILSDEQFSVSKEKLKALDLYDQQKAERENALNSLETAIFNARQNLETDDYKAATTPEESENILKMCNSISEWLEDEGFDASSETYMEKLKSLQQLTNDLYERVFEHKERPEALKGMASMLNGSRNFLTNMQSLNISQEIFTEVEIKTLETAINETQEFYDTVVTKTSETKLHLPVPYKVRDIANKMAMLDREVKYLVNKAKIWRPKVDPVKSASNTTQNVEEEKSNDKESKDDKKSDKSEKEAESKNEEAETMKQEETLELPGASDEEPTKPESATSKDKHSEL